MSDPSERRVGAKRERSEDDIPLTLQRHLHALESVQRYLHPSVLNVSAFSGNRENGNQFLDPHHTSVRAPNSVNPSDVEGLSNILLQRQPVLTSAGLRNIYPLHVQSENAFPGQMTFDARATDATAASRSAFPLHPRDLSNHIADQHLETWQSKLALDLIASPEDPSPFCTPIHSAFDSLASSCTAGAPSTSSLLPTYERGREQHQPVALQVHDSQLALQQQLLPNCSNVAPVQRIDSSGPRVAGCEFAQKDGARTQHQEDDEALCVGPGVPFDDRDVRYTRDKRDLDSVP
mmetsp:Transcript_23064/g.46664  ORF Transcript_23064/g.46664 Transcript_23064/m.46664 type:complete len:291 (+) Transcript_23064:175-1047(+)|eukprot:CAMPEP_0181288456 /NCGR_PEP_ID=MMETSP1101-20121128/341_1 /TAXON_ID=46948 /ORGANISM="Rhodomonas abbreviata, Strain Caron Lab Isolate" /LENGTH=290 /DNA_ID=CAMNT_0023392577 /DNA_START=161 /DNA_END=1033 /DNA_ORIENTATION=+